MNPLLVLGFVEEVFIFIIFCKEIHVAAELGLHCLKNIPKGVSVLKKFACRKVAKSQNK